MPALLHALSRNAMAGLLNGEPVDLLIAAFEIEADPAKPDDEDAMRQNLRVDDAFTRDVPWLSHELDAIRKICDLFSEDFDRPAETLLRAALLARRYEIEEVKECNMSRPLLALVTPMVGVWALGWTVRLEDALDVENAAERIKPAPPPVKKNPAWPEDLENPGTEGAVSGADDRLPEGKVPSFAYNEYLNDSAMDTETLEKVRNRIHTINTIMKGIVTRLNGE